MGRPQYETEDDLQEERQIISKLRSALSCQSDKLPISYGLDYSMSRDGNVIAFVEVKRRQNYSGTYDTIFVSALKRMKARELTLATGLPCFFVVGFDDGVFMLDFKEQPDSIERGGRKDRGDSADMEPVVHYKIERMKFVPDPTLTPIYLKVRETRQ